MLPTVKVSRPKGFLLGKLVHHVHICCIPSPSSRSTKLKTSQLWPFVTRRWCCPSWYAHKLLKYMQEGKDILLRFSFDLITSLVPTPLPHTSLPMTSFSHKTSCCFAFPAVCTACRYVCVLTQTGSKVPCTGKFHLALRLLDFRSTNRPEPCTKCKK